MAIYHCSVKMIGRSTGRSAVACAAYRSGDKLHSEETDRTFDYSKKSGVIYSEIALCEHAPEQYLDRETLWNAVQTVENKSNSQLAREFEVALPIECTEEQWKQMGREYAAYMTSQGMIADWSIHNPISKETGIAQNPHIHMMCTTRPIKEDGSWGVKEKKGYLLDKDGNRIPVIDPKTGEQKIGDRNRKVWQRGMVESTGWNSKEKLAEWRATWADTVNKHLEVEKQIDHRSNVDRGLETLPTVHEGFAARQLDKELMEKQGVHAEVVQNNINIRKQNELIIKLNEMIAALKERAGEIYERYKEQITEHRGVGSIFDRVRNAFGISKAGESGTERREREVTKLVSEVEHRESKADSRERETAELIKAESVKAAEQRALRDRAAAIDKEWHISGSIGTHFEGLYKEVGKQIITNNALGAMNSYEKGYRGFDRGYNAQVFVVSEKYLKKAEKTLKDVPHKTLPINHNGNSCYAIVVNDVRYREDIKLKGVETEFYIYLDHKKPEPVFTVPRKSIAEQIAEAKALALEKEITRTEPVIEHNPVPGETIDDDDGPTIGSGWGMSL